MILIALDALDSGRGKDVPRMPLETEEKMVIAGVPLPLLKLAPFEASAPLKLKMALLRAAPDNAN